MNLDYLFRQIPNASAEERNRLYAMWNEQTGQNLPHSGGRVYQPLRTVGGEKIDPAKDHQQRIKAIHDQYRQGGHRRAEDYRNNVPDELTTRRQQRMSSEVMGPPKPAPVVERSAPATRRDNVGLQNTYGGASPDNRDLLLQMFLSRGRDQNEPYMLPGLR